MESVHTHSTDAEAELGRAVDLFSKDEEFLDGGDLEIAAGYCFRGHRAFTKGDGFGALLNDVGPVQFRVSNGRRIIPHTGLTVSCPRQSRGRGLAPLGHMVGLQDHARRCHATRSPPSPP
jgi:hypothetical protein